MANFKKTKAGWASKDWINSMFQDHVVTIAPTFYFIKPEKGKVVNPARYKITIEEILE